LIQQAGRIKYPELRSTEILPRSIDLIDAAGDVPDPRQRIGKLDRSILIGPGTDVLHHRGSDLEKTAVGMIGKTLHRGVDRPPGRVDDIEEYRRSGRACRTNAFRRRHRPDGVKLEDLDAHVLRPTR
jgi:hypothetical protein